MNCLALAIQLPIDDIDEFSMLPSDVRDSVLEWVEYCREIADANLKAEEQMHSRHKALRILPTESMAQRRRELNQSVDRLAKEDRQQVAAPTDRGPWDSEHRRQHDALARKKKDQLTTAAGIIAVAILILINAELAARCFDSPVPQASRLPQSEIFLTTNSHE